MLLRIQTCIRVRCLDWVWGSGLTLAATTQKETRQFSQLLPYYTNPYNIKILF